PYAVRYVLSEEPLPRTRCARLLAHKAIECGTDALFSGGEELALLLRGRLHEPLEAQQEPELTREAQRLDQRHEHPPELRSAPLRHELLGDLSVRHERVRHDDIRPANLRTVAPADAEVPVRLLRAHPQRELRDLRAARVDVDTVEVVREHEPRHRLLQRVEARVVLSERLARR